MIIHAKGSQLPDIVNVALVTAKLNYASHKPIFGAPNLEGVHVIRLASGDQIHATLIPGGAYASVTSIDRSV